MKWYVAAPFSRSSSDQWLGAYVSPDAHQFESVPAKYVHDRSRRETNGSGWRDYVMHGMQAYRKAAGASQTTGIITCFPQLPLVIGARQRFLSQRVPVVAWAFNLGRLPTGLKQWVSSFAFRAIDRFVVHSRAEVAACSEWLQLPASKFEYVPLQRAVLTGSIAEERSRPFLVAMGSAGRDYGLLFDVLAELGYPAVVVAGAYAVNGLKVPPNVEIRSGLNIEQCHALLQQARFSVTPIANITTASGQVTLIDAMMYGRAQVVTMCPGSADYLTHESEALMVPPGDRGSMLLAVQRLWEDDHLRLTLGQRARSRMVNNYSDEAIGKRLQVLLDCVQREWKVV